MLSYRAGADVVQDQRRDFRSVVRQLVRLAVWYSTDHRDMFVIGTMLRIERFSDIFPLQSSPLSSPDWREW